MIDPPFPVIPTWLLAALTKLGFRITTRDPSGAVELGTLTDGVSDMHLVIASGAVDGVWTLVPVIPPGFPPWAHLVSQRTYDILRGGALSDDGTIAFENARYRLRVWHDGRNLTAEAVVAAPSAA